MLKYALLNNNIGYVKLYRIGLIYRLINYIVDNLKDFRIDWQRYSTVVEALLNILINRRSI